MMMIMFFASVGFVGGGHEEKERERERVTTTTCSSSTCFSVFKYPYTDKNSTVFVSLLCYLHYSSSSFIIIPTLLRLGLFSYFYINLYL